MGWFVDLKQVPRSFVMFQFALLFDAFGSTMWALVFPLVVVSLTHSAFWTTLVTGGGFAAAPLAPWLGAQVDRADKRRLWQSTTLLEATAVGVFAMTIRSDHMMPLYVVMAVFLGITSRLRTLCLGPIARAHVPPTARVGFNSFASTVALVAGYVGPGVGGIILPWLGPTLALAINAVTDLFPCWPAVGSPRYRHPPRRRLPTISRTIWSVGGNGGEFPPCDWSSVCGGSA